MFVYRKIIIILLSEYEKKRNQEKTNRQRKGTFDQTVYECIFNTFIIARFLYANSGKITGVFFKELVIKLKRV